MRSSVFLGFKNVNILLFDVNNSSLCVVTVFLFYIMG